jgi:type II secretory pathway component GspD/PulD (secretin)
MKLLWLLLLIVPFGVARQREDPLGDANDPVISITRRNVGEINKFDVDIVDGDIREVLPKLFRRQGQSYFVSSSVRGKVTAHLKNVGFELALQSVVRQVGATYRADGGAYYVINREAIEEESPLLLIRLDVPGQSFNRGLQKLMKVGLDYRIEGGEYFLMNQGRKIGSILPPSP